MDMKSARCEYIGNMAVYKFPKRRHRARNAAVAFAGTACLYALATAPIIHSGYEYKGRWTTAFIGAPGSETVNDVIANNNYYLPEAYFGDSAVEWGKIIRQHNPQIMSIHQITEPIEVPLPEDAAKPENLKSVRTSVYGKLSAFLR